MMSRLGQRVNGRVVAVMIPLSYLVALGIAYMLQAKDAGNPYGVYAIAIGAPLIWMFVLPGMLLAYVLYLLVMGRESGSSRPSLAILGIVVIGSLLIAAAVRSGDPFFIMGLSMQFFGWLFPMTILVLLGSLIAMLVRSLRRNTSRSSFDISRVLSTVAIVVVALALLWYLVALIGIA